MNPGDDGVHPTYCRLCEAQCGILAEVSDGKIVNILPDYEHPVSKGHFCVKAKAMLDITYDSDRVVTPLRRKGQPGKFEPVSWEEALDDIAVGLKSVLEQNGPNAVSSYIGNPAAFSTMHYAYGYGFARLLGAEKVFNAQHVDTGARTLASDQVYGSGTRFPFPDLPDTHLLFIFGGNPLVSHMSLICAPRARNQLDDIAKRDGVIVIDPRRTETARRYEHQAIKPDGDAWLLIGLLKALIETEKVDRSFIEARVAGWPQLEEEVRRWSWDTLSEGSEISETDMRELAARFAKSRAAVCYGRVGTNRGRFSTLANILMDALNLVTGNVGKSGGSLMGMSPMEPVGTKPLVSDYGTRRSRFGDIPIVGHAHPGGSMADEILIEGPGQIRAFFLDSGNPVLSYPDGERLAEALESLKLFVSLDIYINESNRFADYILPVTTFYERSDINDMWAANSPEPWLHFVEASIPPIGECRHEYDIYSDLLERMGLPNPISHLIQSGAGSSVRHPALFDVVDNLLRKGRFGDGYGENPDGISIKRLKETYPHGFKPLDRMPPEYTWERVAHKDGKAHLWNELVQSEFARLHREPRGIPTGKLRLFGRRLLHSMNSWMHNSDKVRRNSQPTLLMHPDNALERQIRDKDRVTVTSQWGQVEVMVEITSDVVKGSVNYPHGFGHDGGWTRANQLEGANINVLASSDPDDWEPVSGNCHLDGVLVEVRPLP